jgi:hypothetical protein
VSIPMSKDDFVRIGKRFSREDILSLSHRVLPLAVLDIDKLSAGGFTPGMLAELTAQRDQACALIASSRDVRGAKKGARAGEGVVLENARNTLTQGLAIATVSIVNRRPAQGEDLEAAREKAAELEGKLRELRGASDRNATALLTRLVGLREILRSQDFAPSAEQAPGRDSFLACLDAVIANVRDQAESKKSLRDLSKDRTSQVAEITGRLYSGLCLLCRVGKAVFHREGDPDHARNYTLWEVGRKGAKLAQVVPLPAQPGPEKPVPISPEPVKPAANG